MKKSLDWWDLGTSEILVLSTQFLNFLMHTITQNYKSLNYFRRKLGMGTEIYHIIKFKKQGISVAFLKKILKELNLDFTIVNKNIVGIGRYKSLKDTAFPIEISPYWGELLAHSFFDGYADNFIMRYSNYDENNRKEFVLLVKKIFSDKLSINTPENYERDIDLPAIIPRLLSKFFGVKVFYSDRCKLSKKFFDFVREDERIGYYFLKGAFMDEGTITGGQIFIVRSIKNKKLAKDMKKLCQLLKLNAKVKLSNKKLHAYSVALYNNSWEDFYDILRAITWHHNYKIAKINKMLILSKIPRNRDIYGRFTKTEIGRIINAWG